MIVVTAGTAEYRDIITEQRKRCLKFGYAHMTFDLGGLGIGQPWDVKPEDLQPTIGGDTLPPATFKAELFSKAMRFAVPRELVCWLDGDCLPLMEFQPHMPTEDIAVTLRPKPEIGLSNNPALDYLNSGVVWIRNSPQGRAGFLWNWVNLSKSLNTDQGALNQCVGLPDDTHVWADSMGSAVELPTGGRALILDCTQWNSWHLPPKPDTRILHFKRGIRAAARNYL